jgi:uncharacterized protein (DUF2336 family)
MIVRQFLHWVQTAPPGDRAEATSALARAYLYSDLSGEDRLAAEAAMITLLDDPSPLVRHALADALGSSPDAPHGVIIGLAHDQPDIATFVVGRSPVLCDAELLELAAGVGNGVQSAVAGREPVSRALSSALAEVAGAAACLVLIENPRADILPAALARIAERHGQLAVIREALLPRADLPIETRQALVARLSETLAWFVTDRDWIPEDRAHRLTREACDRATVAIASATAADEIAALVQHLVSSGQLTGNLMLRALLCGNMQFLIDAFAELSGIRPDRVAAILSDRNAHGFRALYDRAGLPPAAFGAFRVAIEVINETGFVGDRYGAATLKRRMIERVLTRYETIAEGELDQLLAMLKRFAAEAAREEARYYTADLVAAA